MIHEDKYDELCRVITDYEGNGTEDSDVIDNIECVNGFLHDLAEEPDMSGFVRETIQRTVNDNCACCTDEEIYSLAVRCQNYWDDIWDSPCIDED